MAKMRSIGATALTRNAWGAGHRGAAAMAYIDRKEDGWYPQSMRAKFWIVAAVLVLSGQWAWLGCGDSDSSLQCDEGGCECRDQNVCDLNCGDVVDCAPTCLGFGDLCTMSCVDDCTISCRQGAVCDGLCGDNCEAHCSSVDACSIETGTSSQYRCLNTSACSVELGDDSSAVCTSVGTCNVRCLGTCTVACISAGQCNIDCREGDSVDCGGGIFVCGLACP